MTVQLFTLTGSSSLSKYGYEPGAEDLGAFTVEFLSGARWKFVDVPYQVLENFLLADSRGRFFAERIKGQFLGSEVERDA